MHEAARLMLIIRKNKDQSEKIHNLKIIHFCFSTQESQYLGYGNKQFCFA